jgi:hypothetical protein
VSRWREREKSEELLDADVDPATVRLAEQRNIERADQSEGEAMTTASPTAHCDGDGSPPTLSANSAALAIDHVDGRSACRQLPLVQLAYWKIGH